MRFDVGWIARHSTEEAVRDHAGSATEMLQHAIEASQRIMMNLRPPILDQGLVAAVQWLAESFERRTGIPPAAFQPGYDPRCPATCSWWPTARRRRR